MSNYQNTKATIAANVYTNHNNEVTAEMVKAGINAVVDTLIAGGFLYKGVATTSTNPGSPDANVFYIATAPGTYTNFGSLVVADGEVCILKYNGSWSKEVTGAATAAEVTALGQEVSWIQGEYPFTFASLNLSYNTNSSVLLVKANPGDVIDVTPNTDKYFVYALLKSFPNLGTTSNVNISSNVVDGGGRVATSSNYRVTIPSDGCGLIVQGKTPGNDRTPTSIRVNSVEILSGILTSITKLGEKVYELEPHPLTISPVTISGAGWSVPSFDKLPFIDEWIYKNGTWNYAIQVLISYTFTDATHFQRNSVSFLWDAHDRFNNTIRFVDDTISFRAEIWDNNIPGYKDLGYTTKWHLHPDFISEIDDIASHASFTGSFPKIIGIVAAIDNLSEQLSETFFNAPDLIIKAADIPQIDSIPAYCTDEFALDLPNIPTPNSVASSLENGKFCNISQDIFVKTTDFPTSGIIDFNGHKLCVYSHSFQAQPDGILRKFNFQDVVLPSTRFTDQDFNQLRMASTGKLISPDYVLDDNFSRIEDSDSTPYIGGFNIQLPESIDVTSWRNDTQLYMSYIHEYRVCFYAVTLLVHDGHNYLHGELTSAPESPFNTILRIRNIYPVIEVFNHKEQNGCFIQTTTGDVFVPYYSSTLYIRDNNSYVSGASLVLRNAVIVTPNLAYGDVPLQGRVLPSTRGIFHNSLNLIIDKCSMLDSELIVSGDGLVEIENSIFNGSFGRVIQGYGQSDSPNISSKITIRDCHFENCARLGDSLVIHSSEAIHIADSYFKNFNYGAIYTAGDYGASNYVKSTKCVERCVFDNEEIGEFVAPDGGAVYQGGVSQLAIDRYNVIKRYNSIGGNVGFYYDVGCPNVYCFNNIVYGSYEFAISMRYIQNPGVLPINFTPNINKFCIANLVGSDILIGCDDANNSRIVGNLLCGFSNIQYTTGKKSGSFGNAISLIPLNLGAISALQPSLAEISFTNSPWRK